MMRILKRILNITVEKSDKHKAKTSKTYEVEKIGKHKQTECANIQSTAPQVGSLRRLTSPTTNRIRADGGVQAKTAEKPSNQQQLSTTSPSLDEAIETIEADSNKVVVEHQRLEELQGATHELASAAEQISESTDEVNGVATEQAENLSEVAKEASDLSATIEEIASSSEEVRSESENARELAEESQDATADAINAMGEVDRPCLIA